MEKSLLYKKCISSTVEIEFHRCEHTVVGRNDQARNVRESKMSKLAAKGHLLKKRDRKNPDACLITG